MSSRRAAGTRKSEAKNCWRFSHPVESNLYLVLEATVLYAVGAFGYLQFFRGVNRDLFGVICSMPNRFSVCSKSVLVPKRPIRFRTLVA